MIIVTGAASGLGLEIVLALARQRPQAVIGFDKEWGHDVCRPEATFGPPPPGLEILINCAGINRPDWFPNVKAEDWAEVFDVNCRGIFTMARWAYPAMKDLGGGTIVNIVSNASHMPMRCSAAYNASKAGAHMLTLQLARELSEEGFTIFGISPNKLAGTGMSRAIDAAMPALRGMTADEARRHQLAALPAGAETPPSRVAEFIAFLLSDRERHRYLTGCVLPYGA